MENLPFAPLIDGKEEYFGFAAIPKKFKIFRALQNSHYILGDSSHMVPLQNKRNITTLVVNGVHILYMILTSDFYCK